MREKVGYVFWHWPHGGSDESDYEVKLGAFQRMLKDSHTPGLEEALSFRTRRLPWRESNTSHTYEDWYVVKDFAALELLNRVAVSSALLRDHDAVARMAEGGEGGIYRCLEGHLPLGRARFATWFRKPSGMSYALLHEHLKTRIGRAGLTLWQRQLSLGPAPEFCIHSEEAIRLRKVFETSQVELQIVGVGRG